MTTDTDRIIRNARTLTDSDDINTWKEFFSYLRFKLKKFTREEAERITTRIQMEIEEIQEKNEVEQGGILEWPSTTLFDFEDICDPSFITY